MRWLLLLSLGVILARFSILNWLLYLLINVRGPLVGGVSVGVKPVHMISGGIGATPSLQRGVDPTYCLYYFLFVLTPEYSHSILSRIVGARQGEEF